MKDLTTLEKRILIAASELLLEFDSLSRQQIIDKLLTRSSYSADSIYKRMLMMKKVGLLRWPKDSGGEITITQIGEKWLELIQDEDI